MKKTVSGDTNEFINLRSTTLTSEATLPLEAHGLVNWDVRKDQSHILFANKAILVEVVHVKSELNLCLHIWVVHFEEAMHELFQVNEAVSIQIEHCEESLPDDTRQLWVLQTWSSLKVSNISKQ